MKLIIEIDLNNVVFQDDANEEVASILFYLRHDIIHLNGIEQNMVGFKKDLFDCFDNQVGKAEVV